MSALAAERSTIPPRRLVSPTLLAMTLAVYEVFLFARNVLADGDTYWHIKAGEWMLAHHQVPRADPFAFTTQGLVWVPHEWLSEIVMALAYRSGGWAGLVILTGLVAALAIGIMAWHLERFLAPLPAYGMLLLTAITWMPSMLARPHMLALPVMVLWAARLVVAREEGRVPSLWLAVLMLLWSNLHGGYMIGLGVAAALAVEAVVNAGAEWRAAARGWAVFMVCAAVAACITPLGLDGILFPFQMLNRDATRFIQEWAAPDFQELQPLEFVLMAALLLGFTGGIRLPWFRVLLFLGLLHSALRHLRFQMQLSVVGFLLLAPALGQRFPPRPLRTPARWPAVVLLVGILALTVARAGMPIVRGDEMGSPVSALKHVPAELRREHVLNGYIYGGFLIFNGIRPYVDGRADLYGDAFLRSYMGALRADPERVRELLSRHDIRWTLLEPGVALATWLDTQPEWRRLYADEFAVIHVRRDAMPGG